MPEITKTTLGKGQLLICALSLITCLASAELLAQENEISPELSDMSEDAGKDLVLVSSPPPVYPKRARARGIEGFVIVSYDISESGTVLNPLVLDSQPARIFDRAAVEAVGQWLYEPMLDEGKAVGIHDVKSKMNFSLRE